MSPVQPTQNSTPYLSEDYDAQVTNTILLFIISPRNRQPCQSTAIHTNVEEHLRLLRETGFETVESLWCSYI